MAIFAYIVILPVILIMGFLIKGLYDQNAALVRYIELNNHQHNKDFESLNELVKSNSSDIELLEDANDNPVFKNRVIEILEEHFEEHGTQYMILDYHHRSR